MSSCQLLFLLIVETNAKEKRLRRKDLVCLGVSVKSMMCCFLGQFNSGHRRGKGGRKSCSLPGGRLEAEKQDRACSS